MADQGQSPTTKITFISSPDKEPTIKLRAGAKIELIELETLYLDPKTPKQVLGTLCGWEDTYCVALVEAK